MFDRSWVPILDGNRYCSPACGRGCTIQEHDRALADAKAAIKEHGLKGFETALWENLGWHWKLVKGDLGLYPHTRLDRTIHSWSAGLRTTGSHIHNLKGDGKDPVEAIANLSSYWQGEVTKAVDQMERIEEALS